MQPLTFRANSTVQPSQRLAKPQSAAPVTFQGWSILGLFRSRSSVAVQAPSLSESLQNLIQEEGWCRVTTVRDARSPFRYNYRYSVHGANGAVLRISGTIDRDNDLAAWGTSGGFSSVSTIATYTPPGGREEVIYSREQGKDPQMIEGPDADHIRTLLVAQTHRLMEAINTWLQEAGGGSVTKTTLSIPGVRSGR